MEVLEPVRSFGSPLVAGLQPMPFTVLQSAFDPHRDGGYNGIIAGVDPDPANAGLISQWAKDYWEELHPTHANGLLPSATTRRGPPIAYLHWHVSKWRGVMPGRGLPGGRESMAMWQDTPHASAGARHTTALFARYDDEVIEVTRTEDSFGSVGQQSPATMAYFDGFIDGYQSVDPQLSHVERAKAAVTEAPASHAVYVSQPAVVAQLIKQATNATS